MIDLLWLRVGPTGHYRASDKIDEHSVYVAMHDDGSQVTYTRAEFREKFDWKNDHEKATLQVGIRNWHAAA